MNYVLSIASLIGIYCILSSSLNLIMGYGGMFHMGHGAFFAIGAYAGALIVLHLHLPFLVEMILAGLVTAVLGLVIGLPSIRLKGDYIAFCTYGFAVVVYTIANNWVEVTNGPSGLVGVLRPVIFGIRFESLSAYLTLVVVVLLLCLFIMIRIMNSPYGKSIEAIREDDTATLSCGRNVSALRIQIFCVGAFFAGIAGVLYVHYLSLAEPTSYDTSASFILVSMVIIGGMGSFLGASTGVVVVVLIPQLLSFLGIPSFYTNQLQNIIYSLIVIVIIIKRPQGIFGKLRF